MAVSATTWFIWLMDQIFGLSYPGPEGGWSINWNVTLQFFELSFRTGEIFALGSVILTCLILIRRNRITPPPPL